MGANSVRFYPVTELDVNRKLGQLQWMIEGLDNEIWLNPVVVPSATPEGPIKRDWYALTGAFASAFATPMRMGDHVSLEAGGALVEEELKWKWLR